MYIENSQGYTLNAVEVIGINSVCHSFSLPEPRHSLFGGRLSDRAIVCGGNDGTYERAECFVLKNNANGRWEKMTPDLGLPLIFAAAAGKSAYGIVSVGILKIHPAFLTKGDGRSNFYVIGGRRYDFESHDWEFQSEARVYNKRDNLWRTLQPLPKPIGKS